MNRGVINTHEEKLGRIPIISVSKTPGLTSIEQIVDTTGNEIFSFKDSTSKTEEILVVVYPLYERQEVEIEK
jgi:uncharacterized membrane protein